MKNINMDKVPSYIRRKKIKLFEILTTLYSKLVSRYWGVVLGGNCKFHGKIVFFRAKEAEIYIGKGCRFRSGFLTNFIGINRPCSIAAMKPNSKIEIGNNCGFSGTVIAASEHIKIGDNVMCGGNVTITDTDFHGISTDTRNSSGLSHPVIIEDNVWLGLNVVVLKGVTIGQGSVIAVGSVVNKSIPINVVAGGIPAVVIKKINH